MIMLMETFYKELNGVNIDLTIEMILVLFQKLSKKRARYKNVQAKKNENKSLPKLIYISRLVS